jgi:rRNA maturation RNase YbeY
MPVAASCRTPAGRPWRAYVAARARQVLRTLDLGGRELSLSLVGDAEMRMLNRGYRRRDRTTDVLAFALDESDGARGAPAVPRAPLGDVVISIDTAVRQARQSRRPLAERLDALLIHGILHLVGYDHEISSAEARRMQRRAREVRAALQPPRGVRPPRASGRRLARRSSRAR